MLESEKQGFLTKLLLSDNEKGLIDNLKRFGGRGLEKYVDEHSDVPCLSKFMKKYYKRVVDHFVRNEFQKDYYYMIDKFNQFQYATGVYRRSVRTANYGPYVRQAFDLMKSYYSFGIYRCGVERMADFLSDEMSEELVNFKYNCHYTELAITNLDDMIAARIDAGDQKVIHSIKDMFMSENNTVVVTTEVIRAVIKASDYELHKLLSRFLLAARLSEGIRQVICEHADCGTKEAFYMILDTMKENHLLRFAAVKRAVATWTGVCSMEHVDRITEKVFDDIVRCIKDRNQAREFIRSEDAVHIVVGLWSLGFYEVEDAIKEMEEILVRGNRVQILAMSYFNLSLVKRNYAGKVAARVMEAYHGELEMVAAFMPTYMEATGEYVRRIASSLKEKKHRYLPIHYLFDSEIEARGHFELLQEIFNGMTKKQVTFHPIVFPWYSVELTKSQVLSRMSLIAYALSDKEMIDWVCTRMNQIETNGDGDRDNHITMLLSEPEGEIQRKVLLSYLVDKGHFSRKTAFELVDQLELSGEEYPILEGYLKYKSEDLRRYVIKLLEKSEDVVLVRSIERLLHADNVDMRLAGLDLLRTKKKQSGSSGIMYESLIPSLSRMENVSEQEKILIDEITGAGKADNIIKEVGFGLYQPEVTGPKILLEAEPQVCLDFFRVTAKQVSQLFIDFYQYMDQHAEMEYKDCAGNENLLGNITKGYSSLRISHDSSLPYHKQFAFEEVWKEFYDTYVKEENTLISMHLAFCQSSIEHMAENEITTFLNYEKQIFGEISSDYMIPNSKYIDRYRRLSSLHTILMCMLSMTGAKIPRLVAKHAIAYVASQMPEEALWYNYRESEADRSRWETIRRISFVRTDRFWELIKVMREWKNDEEFWEMFVLLYNLDQKEKVWSKLRKEQGEAGIYVSISNHNHLNMYDYIKAYSLGKISRDMVYKAVFETIGVNLAVKELGTFMLDTLRPVDKNALKNFIIGDDFDRDSLFYQNGVRIYKELIDRILDVELKRGDSPTIFSEAAKKITKIFGMERLIEILKAFGNLTLDRRTYYYGSCGDSKKEVLSHLLQVCYPIAGDDSNKLKEFVKEYKIKEERLIEIAMYAPQWMDLIESCLDYDGLKSGCYYFMAHMNERFDDRKVAMIAKYTPLSMEELTNGCFDVRWFYEAYEKLGEKRFNKLYASAKYISDGNKHSRARKYADAALNRVTVEELECAIDNKRNKDFVMSYGILPVKDTREILHRYEYLQKFLKESKQFGAQRKASESGAVQYALKNLATTAGYSDETRLMLAMETELVKENESYFDWCFIDGYQVKIEVDRMGKVTLRCEKNGKKLQSVPAVLKKNQNYLEMKAFYDKLKAQYVRTVAMLEHSMEEREVYSLKELFMLCENPVTKRLIENLVFVEQPEHTRVEASKETLAVNSEMLKEDNVDMKRMPYHGIIKEGKFVDLSDQAIKVAMDVNLRVAHPFDLYSLNVWSDYQKYFFEKDSKEGGKQPFKQVFRELYVKLPEEHDKFVSLMFAGNQIQPKKTIACLKGRRWIADYEEGLQKIYYKDNVIAVLYAIADWFSPADSEEPVLEWVQFMDRNTMKAIKILDLPDILYSEVMRDVDLAVSVAHAGGVDPETSHSTIEMRKVVLQFNLELFAITNVSFDKSHAIIDGKHGRYSIHLGSGVIHKIGGHQINVVMIQGSKRGKIFLPFVDEDPKTAEIMTKVLTFAEDDKIKDPYIMMQVMR